MNGQPQRPNYFHGGVDHGIVDGGHRFRLMGLSATTLETVDHCQRLMDAGRDQLSCGAPLKHPADVADPLIDQLSSQPFVDHLLADHLEGGGAKLGAGVPAVETSDRAEGKGDVSDLRRGPAVLPVVIVGKFQVGNHQLDNGQSRLVVAWLNLPAVLQPLGHEAVVFELAGLRAVRAEIVSLAFQIDDGLAAAAVLAILR